MESAEQVSKLVLISEVLVPVGAKEKMFCPLPRPPCALEVAVEHRISADEYRADSDAGGFDVVAATLAFRRRDSRCAGRVTWERGPEQARGSVCRDERIGFRGQLRKRDVRSENKSTYGRGRPTDQRPSL